VPGSTPPLTCPPRRRAAIVARAIAAGVLAVGLASAGCRGSKPPAGSAAASAVAMGSWSQWQDLEPLVDVARDHADERTVAVLEGARALLREGKAASADRRLAEADDGAGRHWIAVARGDLAALYFTVCIRGVAWRLEDGQRGGPTDRAVDFSEASRLRPDDVSVEATLTNLDAAVTSEVEALVVQARIARARVAAYTQRCPPNENVAQLAQQILESDLATLAAEGHLTPDLAYLWAGVQMTRFSGAAARPFLLQAREGGFDHPAVTYMLAVITLEGGDLARADELAAQAIAAYAKSGEQEQEAQAHFIRGEAARQREHGPAARKHFEAALARMPGHIPAMLAIAGMEREARGEDAAVAYVHRSLGALLLDGELDQARAREAAGNVEALVIVANEPFLAQLCRDALLADIDDEPDPMRRGIRYFYAATLDVRLREYELALGHGVLAKEELEQSDVPSPLDVQRFLDRLMESSG
jgi:tetratricopeptide (TPR) repeat protein